MSSGHSNFGSGADPEGAAHDLRADNPIPGNVSHMTAEEKDLAWLRNVYQGDSMPQLTLRAVLMGGILGMLMSAANLYTSLAIGWAFGIAITSCVLSYVCWNLIRAFSGGRVRQMSILENTCMASTASAAGYSTGSTIATMFGALVLLADIPEGKTAADVKTWDVTAPWIVTLFTFCTGLMGVFLAIPMKRQQINHEQLPFPSGIAAAETLRSLYSASREALLKAYVLVYGLAAGLLLGFLRAADEILEKLTTLKHFFEWVAKNFFSIRVPAEIEMHAVAQLYPKKLQPVGFAFEPSALLIAAGLIVGMRISASLLIASAVLYLVVGPYVAAQDAAIMEGPAVAVMESVAAVPPEGLTPEGMANAASEAALATAEKEGIVSEDYRHKLAVAVMVVQGQEKKVADSGVVQTPEMLEARVAAAQATIKRTASAEAGKAAALKQNYKPSLEWSWAGGTLQLTRWSLWGGTAVMVFSSLTAVALQWRTILRAFMGIGKGAKQAGAINPLAAIEVPTSWMIFGMLPITVAMVWLQIQAFNVSWYAGVIAVAMSFVLSLVASRATGETDTTPIGAMGKVMQLIFAVLAPNNIHANLASAGIAANSASSSADLLTDLKTGYLLGANPRRQFLAQFFGVFFGTVAIIPIWYLMVPTREALEAYAAPSTRAWEAVARVLVKGVAELPVSASYAIVIGAAIGILLPILERFLPERARKYMPSAMGIGLAWVIPFQNAFSFFVGAVIAWIWSKLHRRSADLYNVPVASGLIAGESLCAAGLAIAATIVGLTVK